jgi:hypothetical protein
VALALGKEATFVECHLIRSTKELVKGPTGSFFAECQYSGHSAKNEPLLSVALWALGKGFVAVSWRRGNDFSLPSTGDTWQSIYRVPDKKVLCKEAVVDVQFTKLSSPSVTLSKAFAEYFSGFAE